MATWSWKTYLMYFMSELYLSLFEDINNIFLIVPAWLIFQHKENLKKIYWINLQWETTSWTIEINWKKVNLIILSVNVLVNKYKEGEFNPQMWESIFIFDEWHKWAWWDSKTEEIKNRILESGSQFLFDWSATFQEVFKSELYIKNKSSNLEINTLNKYFISSIYNYNLTLFQSDWFWKRLHYEFWNLAEQWENPTKINLRKAMESFFKQVEDYEENIENYKQKWIKFYKPLFLAVSNEIWSNKKDAEEQKNNLIDILINFIELAKTEFKDKFNIKWKVNLEVWKEEILINLWDIKWLIYVWSWWIKKIIKEFKKKKYEEILNILEDNLREEIFKKIDEKEDVLFLFWSKKFIEW